MYKTASMNGCDNGYDSMTNISGCVAKVLRKKRAFANFSHIFFGSTDHTQRPASARGGARGFPVPGLPDPAEGGAAGGVLCRNGCSLPSGKLT